ncbi:hypothetical protein [Nocardia terpenica]|uniref:Uncharacterized protein n=1 Tax=Nocardia terpenica TaxID=455432 RepID=A0A164K6L0_9NOCA|nr:hypothetical protein [Nocardia terpenica]KZM71087.1 hypothetical protein AWN90_41995 [Nocardia terpenica]NQE89587.1 hypothetical protein [Nocardia terpenica]
MNQDVLDVLERSRVHGVVIWPLVADIIDSFRLAMATEQVDAATIDTVVKTVADYATNNYDD